MLIALNIGTISMVKMAMPTRPDVIYCTFQKTCSASVALANKNSIYFFITCYKVETTLE